MYITSNMAELPKMLERRDTGEPMHVHVRISCCRALIRLVAAATIRERRLFGHIRYVYIHMYDDIPFNQLLKRITILTR